MAYLAVVGSHKVNGVAELHSLLTKDLFKDFVDILGSDRFSNVTNGITPRRWLLQCNPGLAALITKTLGSDTYLTDLFKLEKLQEVAADASFQAQWAAIKRDNKERLARYIESTLGIAVNRDALWSVQVKRIHLYKRQHLNILSCIYRYMELKKLSKEDRAKVVPRVSIFAGKAAPGYCTRTSFVARHV